jgi:hypothetical protein
MVNLQLTSVYKPMATGINLTLFAVSCSLYVSNGNGCTNERQPIVWREPVRNNLRTVHHNLSCCRDSTQINTGKADVASKNTQSSAQPR